LADQDWIGLMIFKNFADLDWIGFNFFGSGLDSDWKICQSAHFWSVFCKNSLHQKRFCPQEWFGFCKVLSLL